MAFYDIEDNNSYFGNVAELLRHYFARNTSETDEDLWYKIQNLDECRIDPLRIIKIDYRPFTAKYTYYGTGMGIISHPRYEVMKHILPWYWNFTVVELCRKLKDYPHDTLSGMVEEAEQRWFKLPLNAKFLANLNVWRVAVYLRCSGNAKQLNLFY